MRKAVPLTRFVALSLTLNLALPPGSAFALRTQQPVNAGMEESLAQALGRPAAGTEERLYPVVTSDVFGLSVLLGPVSNTLKDMMRGRGGLSMKLPDGRDRELLIVLPPSLFDIHTGTGYGELEFLIYYNAFELKNIGKKPLTVVGTPDQIVKLRQLLEHTLFGPDWANGEYPWVPQALRDFYRQMGNHYTGGKRSLDPFLKTVAFNGEGTAEIDVQRDGKKGTILLQQTYASDQKILNGYAVHYTLDGIPPEQLPGSGSLGSLPTSYVPPDPARFPVPTEARKKLEEGRYGFGVTTLGASTGFDKDGDTTSFVLWAEGVGIHLDPSRESLRYMEELGLTEKDVQYVWLSHIHQDHDGGVLEKILQGQKVKLIVSRLVFEELIKKADFYLGLYEKSFTLDPRQLFEQLEKEQKILVLDPGSPRDIPLPTGRILHLESWWNVHPIPTNGLSAAYLERDGKTPIKSWAHSGDTQWGPQFLQDLVRKGTLSPREEEEQRYRLFDRQGRPKFDLIYHEAGRLPIHTTLEDLDALLAVMPERDARRVKIYHVPDSKVSEYFQEHPDSRLRKPAMFDTDVLVPSDNDRREAYWRSVLESSGLFRGRDLKAKDKPLLDGLLRAAELQTFAPSEEIFRQGDQPDPEKDWVYFIVEGKVGIYTDGQKVAELGPGARLGDWEIVTRESRTATVKAEMPVRAYGISSKQFEQIFLAGADRSEMIQRIFWVRGHIALLQKAVQEMTDSPLPQGFSEFCCSILARDILDGNSSEQTYRDRTEILRRGDFGRDWYVITQGEVIVDADKYRPGIVARLGPGEIFGENAALRGVPRSATVRVSAVPTTVLVFRHELLEELFNQFPRLRLQFGEKIEQRLQALAGAAGRATTEAKFVWGMETIEKDLAEKHMRTLRPALMEDAKALTEAPPSALPQVLGSRMRFAMQESIDRFERRGESQGKDYRPFRGARRESIEEAMQVIQDRFRAMTGELSAFRENPQKQLKLAELWTSIFHLLLLQDEADLELAYVAHSIKHSHNVEHGVSETLRNSTEAAQALSEAYGEAGGYLALISAWLHDIGYGLLTEGEQKAAGLARRMGIPGYKTGKGYHTRLGVVLANTPILGDQTILDQLDGLFGLSGMPGRAAGSRSALEDVRIMIERHGADKKQVTEEGLPGTGKHRYTPASLQEDPLNFVVRLADNLDIDAEARLYLHQDNPFFLALLTRLMEAANGEGETLQKIKDNFRRYAGVMTIAYQRYLELHPELGVRDPAETARAHFDILLNNLRVFDHTNLPHFAGMVESHRVAVEEGQLVIYVKLRENGGLIADKFKDFQVLRMREAYESLSFNGKPIVVKIESSAPAAQPVPAEESPLVAELARILSERSASSARRNLLTTPLLESLVAYLRKHPETKVSEKIFRSGDRIVSENTPVNDLKAESIYFLLEGDLVVLRMTVQGNIPLGNVDFHLGDPIGEMGLLYGRRTATVMAEGEVKALELPAEEFIKLLQDPQFLVQFADLVIARRADQELQSGAEESPQQQPVSEFRELVDGIVQKALETMSGRIGREYIHLSENTGIGKQLSEEARKAGYRGTVAIVPTAYLPENPPIIAGFRVYVQTVGKETVENNLRPFVQIVQDPDKADLIVADLSFETGKRQELLLQGKIFLEVTAETAPAVTPFFLIHLQARGLLEKGAYLFVGKLLQGDLGEGLLIFA